MVMIQWGVSPLAWVSAVSRVSLIMPTHHAQIEPVSLQETTIPVKSAVPPLKPVIRGM
jgi:hypothetical protein